MAKIKKSHIGRLCRQSVLDFKSRLFRCGIFLLVSFLFFPSIVRAADQNIVTPVYIVRGREYWRQTKDITELTKLISAVEKSGLNSTWLIQFDALEDQQIVDLLKKLNPRHELGLFIEITRKLANKSFVRYDWTSGHWSAANKIFLSGYTLKDRRNLINTGFNFFKDTFGFYPKTYGSWYQDGYSLEYIKEKYNLDTVLGLSDQYSTDGYQTWGQYINQPYYVSKKSSLEPALNEKDNTGVVKVLWAPREPTLSYGSSKEFSNYSLQANDYHRTKGLSINFFNDLLNTSTVKIKGPLAQIVVGIEVSELEPRYFQEIINQLNLLELLQKNEVVSIKTLSQFGKIYHQTFKEISPSIFTQSTTKDTNSYWYDSPLYRAGFFYSNGQLELRDLRFYHQNGYRDNDQIWPDKNPNLTRVVPAIIDDLVLKNKLSFGKTAVPKVVVTKSLVTIAAGDNQIKLYPEKITIAELKELPIPIGKTTADIKKKNCFNEYGGYQKLPCLKKFTVFLTNLIPDIRYSNLFGQKYLGFKVGPENLLAIRFPNLKIAKFHFDYPLLEDFITSKKYSQLEYPWLGKQEMDLKKFTDIGQIHNKFSSYGEDNIPTNEKQNIIFENSYYFVTQK